MTPQREAINNKETTIYVQMPAKWVVENRVKIISPAQIILLVSLYYGITVNEMISKTRIRTICEARQMAMLMLKTFTAIPLIDIGVLLGNRHHTSVIHGVKTIRALIDTEYRFKMDKEILSNKIKTQL